MIEVATRKGLTYCRGCGYVLHGLAQNRCPECGRAFDPADRKTYATSRRALLLRRWLRRLLPPALILALLTGAPTGWLYHGWKAEQPVLAAIDQVGGSVTFTSIGPRWLRTLTPRRFEYLYVRAEAVELWLADDDAIDRDLRRLTALHEMRELTLDVDKHPERLDALKYLPSL